MANHQRRKSHRVSQPGNQTDGRFDGPSRLVVAVNEDERDEEQRHNCGHGGVVLRLRHLIVFQHRFARDAHIDTRHFGFGLRHQFAQPLHGLVIQVIAPGAGRDDVNATLGERDIDLLLGLLAGVKQRGEAGRWRRARTLQTVGSLQDDSFHCRQRFGQRFILRVFFAPGGAKLVVDQTK